MKNTAIDEWDFRRLVKELLRDADLHEALIESIVLRQFKGEKEAEEYFNSKMQEIENKLESIAKYTERVLK